MKKIMILFVFPIIILLSFSWIGCTNTIKKDGTSTGGGSSTSPAVLFSEDFSSYSEGANISTDWVWVTGGSVTNTIAGTEKAVSLIQGVTGMLFYNGMGCSSLTNYTLYLKFKVSSATCIIGFFFRTNPVAENECSYYEMCIDGSTNKYAIVKNPANIAACLSIAAETGTGFSFAPNTYYPLKIVVNNGNIKAYFSDSKTPFADCTDIDIPVLTTGSFGFAALSGGNLYVDDIVITGL
jgi:hypothetical protein